MRLPPVAAQQQIQSQETEVPRSYSISFSQITSKLSRIALSAFALYALANIQGAEAGPLAYSACCIACTGSGPAAPFCWTCCLAALFAPGP